MSAIADATRLVRAKSLANGQYCRSMHEAEGNRMQPTPAHLELAKFQPLGQNAKIYFTGSWSNLVIDPLTRLTTSLKQMATVYNDKNSSDNENETYGQQPWDVSVDDFAPHKILVNFYYRFRTPYSFKFV